MKPIHILTAALGLSVALGAAAQTKWDMPTAYPASNFHTENIAQFVADVDKATGGKLKITVHANASLFKANEIKRAVQGNQAQAGEILLVNFENEDPMFGLDGVPFLATGYADAMKLYKARAKALEEQARQAGHQAAVHGGVAAAGHLHQPDAEQRGRHEGAQVARVQSGDLAHRRAGRRAAGDRAGRGAHAGARHRRRRLVHVVVVDRLRLQDLREHQEFLRHAGMAAQERGHRQSASVRRAGQGDAGRGAQGRGRCRSARLESVRGKERLVPRPAQAKRDDHHQAERAAERRPEEGRRGDAAGLAEKIGRDGQAVVDAFRKM